MKDKRCFICKYKNKFLSSEVHPNFIFSPTGEEIKIDLCWSHSVDLFKFGQVKFFQKFKENFNGSYGSASDEAIIEKSGALKKKEDSFWFAA